MGHFGIRTFVTLGRVGNCLYQPLKHQFTIWRMAAIFDLEAITRPDHKTDIKYEFLDPKNPRKHMLISTVLIGMLMRHVLVPMLLEL